MINPYWLKFWHTLDRLTSENPVVIERQKGSYHPDNPSLIYPLDYGYLENTTASDGGGIDVFVGEEPERNVNAVLITLDSQKRVGEMQVLMGCSPQEIQAIQDFVNQGSQNGVMLSRQSDAIEWLKTRRSVRHFTQGEISRETIEKLLEAATWAPSAHNRQPWRFVVVFSIAKRQSFAQAMGAAFYNDLRADGLTEELASLKVSQSIREIQEAPVAIVLCLDQTDMDRYPDRMRQEFETILAIQSVALAGGQFLLAAHAQGLGACWNCAPLFASSETRHALNLPPHWQPQALILVGQPVETPEPPSRLPMDKVVRYI